MGGIRACIKRFSHQLLVQEIMGTLGYAAIYNFEKTQGALNHGFLSLFVAVEWRKVIMG
jgi:hypothetical protein